MTITSDAVEIVTGYQAKCNLCPGWATKPTQDIEQAGTERYAHITWHRDYEHALEILPAWLDEHGVHVVATEWEHNGQRLAMIGWNGHASIQLVLIDLRVNRLRHGSPLDYLSNSRRGVMRELATAWQQEHRSHANSVRIDVVGVLRHPSGLGYTIEHLRGVG